MSKLLAGIFVTILGIWMGLQLLNPTGTALAIVMGTIAILGGFFIALFWLTDGRT